MAKKMKLNLNQLKVHSFVTSLKADEAADVKGGSGYFKCTYNPDVCNTDPQQSCPDTEEMCTDWNC